MKLQTLKFPVAAWQDAEGAFTARTLSGEHVAAIDRTLAEVLAQIKKYLAWQVRNNEGIGTPDLDDLELRDHRVAVRPEYRTEEAVYPVSSSLNLRVSCIYGRRRDGVMMCILPTLDQRFAYQPGDPIEDLIREGVQQALGRLTPQELSRQLMPQAISLHAVHVRTGAGARRDSQARWPTLESVAELLGSRSEGSRFARALMRDKDVRLLVDRLKGQSSNVLLLGENGVGKTTVLVEAVRQIARQKGDKADKGDSEQQNSPRRQFWLTSGQRLIAGMKYLGQWEERCEKVVEELAESGSALCVDNLLELVRVGGREPGASVAAFLMPYLKRGELRLVTEATAAQLDACRRLLPGLADLFQIVRIGELTPADARALLDKLLDHGRRNLKLEIEPMIADLVYRLYKRFQPYAAFPGRSASLVRHVIDDVAKAGGKRVSQLDVLARFQRETGLPERLLRDDLPLPHEEVLADFRAAVLGQEAACQAAAGVVTALKTGLNDPRRPLGVLLFCGPTGVGKTEMAKALARYLFGAGGTKDRLVRLDMSEYSGYGSAQRLLLSADGEVSDFIKRVRRQPFVVVLLDEIEKAAPEVLDLLLGVLDEGRLTDRFGRTTTLASAVIVMTSNLGAERTAAIGFDGSAQPAFERIAMGTFRPEFFNRIDAVVTFQPLVHETIVALARRELAAIGNREGFVKNRLRLDWNDQVVEHLAAAGFDARYGARPLLRAIERLVVAPLAAWLLAHPAASDRTLWLELDKAEHVVVCS